MKHLISCLMPLILLTACEKTEKPPIKTTINLPDAVNGQAYYTEIDLPALWENTGSIEVYPNRYANIKLIGFKKIAISHEANFNDDEIKGKIYLTLHGSEGGGRAYQRHIITLALEVHKPTARILQTCKADSIRPGTAIYHCDFYHQAMDKGAKQGIDCYQYPEECGLQDYIRPYWMENGWLKGEKDL